MIELCDVCGAVQAPGGGCSCGGAAAQAPLALDLELDRSAPPPRPSAAPNPARPIAPVALPMPPPLMPSVPQRPMPVAIGPSSGTIKLVVIGVVVALFIAGTWVLVSRLKQFTENAADEAITRAYPAPNRLVVASVTSDYGSEALADGSLLLRKLPEGPAAGLAGFYGGRPGYAGALDEALTRFNGATYQALETPAEPCRSDADTSTTTLGEITFPTSKVTVWTCTLTKKKHTYFLVWAAPASATDDDRYRALHILKSSQLVSNDMCAMNVINGGCSPDASALLEAVVKHARR